MLKPGLIRVPTLNFFILLFSMKMTSKRRRTKQQIEDDKAAAQAKAEALEEKLGLIDRLQQELTHVQAQQ